MITVFIGGGMGNQLFQYAAARSLAQRHGTTVRLDLHKFRRGGGDSTDPAARPYMLDKFALCDVTVAGTVYSRWARLRRRLPPDWRKRAMPNLFEDKMAGYNPDIRALPDGTYLSGFFVSELYFNDIAERIRSEFVPADRTVVPRIDAALQGLRRPGRGLVSLHVRRGDYLGVERMVVPVERYRAAMQQFDGADFLVFSDDLAWCKANLAAANMFYSPFDNGFDDFIAMSRCDHHIIANSTFSWWAAWLNPRPDRTVVGFDWRAPAPRDFYPKSWRLI